MGTERSQRLSDQLRRRPEIPIALVVLIALLVGVLISTSQQDASADSLQVGEAPGATTTQVIPTFTYVVSPMLTTTLPPETTNITPGLTTIPPGGTYVTYAPVTTYYYQTTTTSRYTPVTTYPRPTTYPTYTYTTTTLPSSFTTTTAAPSTSTTVVSSSSTTTTSTSTPSSSSTTTTSTLPTTRPTVLVVSQNTNVDRRVALMKSLYTSGYNPVGVVSDLTTADAVYYTNGNAASTVGLFDSLEIAEPKAHWKSATATVVPPNPPWSPDWETQYNYQMVVVIVGPGA